MAERTSRRGARAAGTPTAPQKLKLLCVIVNRDKAEFFGDVLLGFEVNLELFMLAKGTATSDTLRYLGLADSPKAVIFATIREDRVAEAMACLEEKFRTVKGGRGIAYTIPMTGTIGVAVYQFLCNNRKYLEMKGDKA